MAEMLNVNIKEEKEDISCQDNIAKVRNIPAPTRIVSLKTAKARKGKNGKGKSSVDKIKIKTLDEIRREKKIKKFKKEVRNQGPEETSPAVKPTNTSVISPKVANIAMLRMPNNVHLRPLSVCLMPLPNGRHAGQRTFRVNSFSNVKIKQEPVDSRGADINFSSGSRSESSGSPPSTNIKVKQEPLDNDIDVNNESVEEEETGTGNCFSDLNSESSFEGFDHLSSSIDFSDVPRGLQQDEDTMSLFALDDTFEEETEPDMHQSGRHSIGRSTRNPPTDLRETLQNNPIHDKEETENIYDTNTDEQNSKTNPDQQKWEKRQNNRQRWKDGQLKKKQGRGRGKLGKQQNQQQQNQQQQVPQKYLEELNRMQLLHDVIKGNTQIQVKRGVIPQKQATVINNDTHLKEPDVGAGQVATAAISQLKIRPTVPGGRGFFEDVPLSDGTKEVTLNGGFGTYDITDTRYISDGREGAPKTIISDNDIRKPSDILPFNEKTSSEPQRKHSPRDESIGNDYRKSLVPFNEKTSSDPQRKHSPRDESRGNDYRNPLKRRSSGGDAASSDEGHQGKKGLIAAKKPKQVYCTTQIRLGKCHHSFCRLRHLLPCELEEYNLTGEVKDHYESEEQATLTHPMEATEQHEPQPFVNEKNVEDETEQLCRGVAGAAKQALDAMKICEAWQLIYHLYEIAPDGDPMLITLVERVLVLCGEEGVDADLAAQVSSKAFDLIPKVRGQHNRHDYTNLIRCLCQTGQYIRAYEAYNEMKVLNIHPTHEVYLDLIKSSQEVPDRAFDLLIEIKTLGLFRSSICSALISLACNTNQPILERTWSLFQDMMGNSIKPSKESFMALLEFLADNNQGTKLLDALISYDDSSIVTPAKCNKIVIQQSKDVADMVSASVASVCAVAEIANPQLDIETWNALLSNCYSNNFNFAIKAQDVQRLMKKFQVPFLPQGYNGLLCSLSEGNLTMAVIEVLKDVVRDHVNLNDCKQGITAAVSALIRAKQVDDLVEMVFVLTDSAILVEEKAYLMVLDVLENKKQYERIHSLFRKCRDAGFALSIMFYRKSISALEKWAENSAASLEVYATMKKAYPIVPDLLSQVTREHNRPACKFFIHGRCAFGEKCRFPHVLRDTASNPTDIKKETSVPVRKNPFVLRSGNIMPDQIPPPLPPPPPPPFGVAMPIPPPTFCGSGSFVLRDPGLFPNFPRPAVPEAFLLTKHLPQPPMDICPVRQGNVSAPASAGHETSMGPEVTLSSTVQSAPVFSTNVEKEGFKFPSKTDVQFYKERILKASEEQNFEELARLYVEMKNETVPVCKEMLRLFYSSFTTFNNIGESLSSFVAIIDIQLDNPDVCDDSSARESLDGEDQRFIGELGVALMQLCKKCNRLDEGYLVLHVLHQYSINYFQYPASFLPNEKVLSCSSIALLAADMCLCLEKDPQYDGAVEVLRGCNYALPLDGGSLSLEEAEKRRDTFLKVTAHYLSIGNYTVVYEFLQQVGDKDVFGMSHLKSIYNELLKKYIRDKKVEDAIGIIRVMESEMISRDTNVLRSLVNCLGNIGRFFQAKEIFKSSCLQGAYPAFPQGNRLWNASIWASFSKFEIQFYLEQQLQHLNRHVEEQRTSYQMPYDEKQLKPLRVIIFEEEPNTHLTMEIGKQMQEQIIEILGSDFNPPLSCGVSDVIGEVIVNPRSLRRWFLANPTPNHQSSPTDSEEIGVHQRNVMASEGQLSIRLNVSRSSDHPNSNNKIESVDNKSVMDKIKHTICGHLTRHMRSGVIASKDFKGYARAIADEYFRRFRDIPAEYNKQERTKVVVFVDKYFEKSNNN